LGNALYIVRQPPCEPAVEQCLGIAIGERADHARRLYTRRVHIIKGSAVSVPVKERSPDALGGDWLAGNSDVEVGDPISAA
jgi:hypothetical protein